MPGGFRAAQVRRPGRQPAIRRAYPPCASGEYIRVGHHPAVEEIRSGLDDSEIRSLARVGHAEFLSAPEIVPHDETLPALGGHGQVLVPLAELAGRTTGLAGRGASRLSAKSREADKWRSQY